MQGWKIRQRGIKCDAGHAAFAIDINLLYSVLGEQSLFNGFGTAVARHSINLDLLGFENPILTLSKRFENTFEHAAFLRWESRTGLPHDQIIMTVAHSGSSGYYFEYGTIIAGCFSSSRGS